MQKAAHDHALVDVFLDVDVVIDVVIDVGVDLDVGIDIDVDVVIDVVCSHFVPQALEFLLRDPTGLGRSLEQHVRVRVRTLGPEAWHPEVVLAWAVSSCVWS